MKRNLNVDLLRIIATFLVIILHVLGKGGVLKSAQPGGAVYWVAWFLEIASYCAVNCFAIISGYVMVDKTVKFKNIIGLWLHVLFYSVLISSLFFVFMPELITVKNISYALFPIVGKQWWYVSSYMGMMLLIPLVNPAINSMSKQTFTKLLLVILVVVGIVDCIIKREAFTLNNGYSAVWLLVVYLFGAYIKRFNMQAKISAFKSLLGFLAVVSLTFIIKVIIYYFTDAVYGEVMNDNVFVSYTSITILLAAVFLLLFCLNVKIGSFASKLICLLSPLALGIYLIHVHPLIFKYIFKNSFVSFANQSFTLMIICVLAATVVVFAICAVIEWLRIRLFKFLKISELCEKIDYNLNKVYLKFIKE